MKKFLKGFIIFMGVIATAIGALAVIDKLMNKNRIEGDYLECPSDNEEVE
ncbi:MAG: hypothetical protein PUF48_03775 [Oscillospiraceae bacterium]|nr:hypothetical protein [Oscillospiraceae bacterium]